MPVSTPLNADLHAHSNFSDGLLSPAELVQRAVSNGVDLLALTDHDELGGLPAAREAATALGLRFVPGVEVSVSYCDQSVHIVGLGIDASSPQLVAGLAQVRGGRDGRAQRMGEALEKIGIRDAYAGAAALAGNPALISRAHFARYLVDLGLARDTSSVFDHYLVRGKPGFVEHEWATLSDAVNWIHAAGGLAVIAHPGRYRLSRAQMTELFDQFVELGGEGVEVVTSAHTPAMISEYASVARRYDLLASRASDFHGPGESVMDLGRIPQLPPDLTPVWSQLV
ncbi:3',5'-nucleoside bisphosphate phosphatase [Uliginosibacterium sediminicola]|uniref:3',5'-nucleoside bisphosphate phosphatase n=1 Tax=Uliginosibacterium sediminicola TaxID=2024550 RepID=A0ABU9YZB3_9RHOO